VIRSFVVTLFLILAVVGSFGLRRMSGAHWGILPFDLLVVYWAAASLYDVKQVYGLRIWRLTPTDIIVLLAICCVMHGVAMPAVQTRCQLRRPPAPSGLVIPQVPLSSTDGGSRAGSPEY
jgi:cell division protein FtsX